MTSVDPRNAASNEELDSNRAPLPLDPVIECYMKDIDRTLLVENLKLTVEERLRKLFRLQRFAEEVRRAGQKAGL